MKTTRRNTMKNLATRDAPHCDSADLLSSMFVDSQQEYSISPEDYDQVPDYVRHRAPYFYTGNGRGLVVRQMAILDILHRITSKIAGVRLTTRKQHVSHESTKITEHVYVHLNDEPFYRAVIYFGYDSVLICSHHLDTSDLRRSSRGGSIPRVAGSTSSNCVSRSITLKNILGEVLSVVKKVCSCKSVSVNDFIGVCFKNQDGRLNVLAQANAAVVATIDELIGKGYRYGKPQLDNDLRMAAFLALESVVRGTPMPPVTADVAARFSGFLSHVDIARENAAATSGKVPVQVIKIKGHDAFVAKLGSRVVTWQQLPDAVVAPVATMMSLGADATVLGVGSTRALEEYSPLELDMVVMVDAGENL